MACLPNGGCLPSRTLEESIGSEHIPGMGPLPRGGSDQPGASAGEALANLREALKLYLRMSVDDG